MDRTTKLARMLKVYFDVKPNGLNLAPQVRDAEQALFLEPSIGHGLLVIGGSANAPVTQTTDAVLDCCLGHYAAI